MYCRLSLNVDVCNDRLHVSGFSARTIAELLVNDPAKGGGVRQR